VAKVIDKAGIDRTGGDNLDAEVVNDFGAEWKRFDQSGLSNADLVQMFDGYFHIFPWATLPADAEGADIGCGSGRWAVMVAPRVGRLHLVDPSEALDVARAKFAGQGNSGNTVFHSLSVNSLPFAADSLDFAYSLGVLHHVPDTRAAIASIARVLKPGAPFLVYLYYAFDHRPWWFRMLWRMSNLLRVSISRLPHGPKSFCAEVIAAAIYWPLARGARLLDSLGRLPRAWPLAYYRDRTFYVMRTDALDRFGTRLEKRFTRREVESMLQDAGFERITFSSTEPFWCVVGFKAAGSATTGSAIGAAPQVRQDKAG
jgi:ubiquinone/menaquinone biosynthesis C-methylase UbiE